MGGSWEDAVGGSLERCCWLVEGEMEVAGWGGNSCGYVHLMLCAVCRSFAGPLYMHDNGLRPLRPG